MTCGLAGGRHRLGTFRCLAAALAVSALLWPTRAAAQTIKAGVSWSSVTDGSQVERQPGFVGGVSFLRANNKLGGYQIEVLFHQKGARNLLRLDDRLSLSYLEIPLMMHLDIVQRDPHAVFLIGGVAPAFNVHASYEDDGVKENVTGDIENFDIGFVAGGGVELGPVTVEARYTWGLRRTFFDSDVEGAFKNRTFSVMAGFRIRR